VLGWGPPAQTNKTEVIHPVGEGDFSFATPGGRVRRAVTKEALTPFGGVGRLYEGKRPAEVPHVRS
jgi:hypothetical protein